MLSGLREAPDQQAVCNLMRRRLEDEKQYVSYAYLMTLGGVAAAIGLVIDDAIVVVENIYAHMSHGQSRLEAVHAAIAEITGARLIRLQCYEGLDEAKALYEWNYKKQLLRIQVDKGHEADWEEVESDIFSEPFLLERPLLEAIRAEEPVVLLIDEVDRVEIETEALLLEVLSDFQVSIPELGTVVGNQQRPIVLLTSNNTR